MHLQQLQYIHTNNMTAYFPQSWQSLSTPTGYEDLSKVTLAPHHTFDNAKKAIAELKAQLEDVSKEELSKISSAGEQTQTQNILNDKWNQ